PPTTTLFPYTTLFRSDVHLLAHEGESREPGAARQRRHQPGPAAEPPHGDRDPEGERRGAERDGDERPLERRHAAAEEHERVGAREGRRGPHLERPVDGDGGDRRRTADAAAREEQRAQRLAAQLAARDERGEALARGAVADQRG